jgi:hypothetical protein
MIQLINCALALYTREKLSAVSRDLLGVIAGEPLVNRFVSEINFFFDIERPIYSWTRERKIILLSNFFILGLLCELFWVGLYDMSTVFCLHW